jgi:hypothetical protein
MRKCVILDNIKNDRTDAELEQLWSELTVEEQARTLPKSSFFHSNRTYWEKKRTYGLFHQWGMESTDDDNGVHEYTVGIVELVDGTMATPLPQYIQFLPPDTIGFNEFARMGHQNLGRMIF